ncbi:MAG: MerR family transcriptional regulator [Deltaproteobacteria bacterium]|nr:MerR family transcriptional regulator [Deltaproteobacteria bacterium]
MVQISEDKRYFRIGEASSIIGVEPYVLRYWESEFPQLKPQRADSKQRTYQKKDLETLLEIKRLLYEEKMTIEGAKRRLRQKKDDKTSLSRQSLESIREELREILEILT